MQHDQARRLLSEGRTNAPLRAHLRDCRACRAHGETLETVRQHAPELVPTPPSDLHERIVASLPHAVPRPAEAPAATPGSPVTRLPERPTSRWMAWGAAAAAVAAAAVGVVWFGTIADSHDEPAQVLAAAVQRAQRAAAATSYRYEVAGSALVQLPPVDAGTSPAALGARHGEPDTARAAASVRTVGLEAPVDATLEPPTFQLPSPPTFQMPSPPTFELPPIEPPDSDLFDGLSLDEFSLEQMCIRFALTCIEVPDVPPVPMAADYVGALRRVGTEIGGTAHRDLVTRLHVQLELERLGIDAHAAAATTSTGGPVELRFTGRGRSDGARASGYTLDWEVLQPGSARGSTQVVRSDDRTWVRSAATAPWVATTGAARFHLPGGEVLHDLSGVLDQLAHPAGAVRELGGERLGEVAVRRLTLSAGDVLMEAWVGRDDGLLHRVVVERDGREQTTDPVAMRIVFDLHDHAAAVDVDVPQADVTISEAPVSTLPPFWLDLEATLLAPAAH